MEVNEEWEAQDVIEEDDENFDPLLDHVAMVTLMEEDVESELGSQNGLRCVDVQDPSLRMNEGAMVTRERPKTLGEAQISDIRDTNKSFV